MQNMKRMEICFDFIRNGKVFSNGMKGMGNQDSDRQVWERVVGSLSWQSGDITSLILCLTEACSMAKSEKYFKQSQIYSDYTEPKTWSKSQNLHNKTWGGGGGGGKLDHRSIEKAAEVSQTKNLNGTRQ